MIVQPLTSAAAHHDAVVLRGVLDQLADPDLAALVRALAENLSKGAVLAAGDELVTPAKAGELLGVSRQYIDKLISSGRLPVTHKPGSTHRLVAVVDIVGFERQRRADTSAAADLVGDLLDAGLEY